MAPCSTRVTERGGMPPGAITRIAGDRPHPGPDCASQGHRGTVGTGGRAARVSRAARGSGQSSITLWFSLR